MLVDITYLANNRVSNQRLMGIDYGKKRIGVALSDTTWQMATPHSVVNRTKLKADLEELFKIHDEQRVQAWILGFPLNMDGSEGPRCQATRQFVKDVLLTRDIPIALFDERLSSSAVERMMIEADLSRAKRSKSVDKAAAAFILQGALDALNRGNS